MKTYEVLAKKQDVTLNLFAPEDALDIEMDAQRIAQTVANLLSNAIKFSPRGSCVTVTCGEEANGVFIEVSDTGRGIPVAQQDQIFSAFFQSQDEDTSEKQGMGLGLHVSKTIVELHGGHIAVHSEPGKGSRFRIWLPTQEVKHDE